MSLPTPSQSVSHKQFHQCLNHKKKLSLRHPLPTFGSFSFFQASLWVGVDKVLQKLQNLIKVRSDIYFNVASWFPGNVRAKPYFNTQWGGGGSGCPPPSSAVPKWRSYFSFLMQLETWQTWNLCAWKVYVHKTCDFLFISNVYCQNVHCKWLQANNRQTNL